ncbi:unnamed protein product [Cercopithifilaria johnstoni]|uniref:Transglutaminase-like domain-containing protein n=1 Tax=Cercopithifilaria johnstoni TaxID=2874296 RepID=A0A8J2LZC4_9BILA|nr:unnamed protein product [Cercopithifilaria johnstoni]
MFTQSEEQWKETDDFGNCEYRRRITHEDCCNCYGSRRFRSQSSSADWRRSTDHCGGFNDYVTLYPSHLWSQNILRGRRRQRCCHSSNGYCKSCSRCSRHKCWDVWNSADHIDQFVENMENLGTVRIIPTIFVSKSTTKDLPNFQTSIITDSRNIATDSADSLKATNAPYYGPFRARKIKITPAITAVTTRRHRSIHEHYLSERKYMRKIQNDKPKISKHLTFINEPMNNKSNDSKIVSDAYHDTISKHICSEFDEIPLSKISTFNDQCSSLEAPANITDKFDEILEKNLMSEENHHETGRDTLMEGLALLKDRKKAKDEKTIWQTIPVENNRFEIYPIITKNLIKKITTYWHKRTFKKLNEIKKFSQKFDPSKIDQNSYEQHIQQNDLMKSETIPINVENISLNDITDDIDSGSESKFIVGRCQEQENNSELMIGNGNVSKSEITSTDTELEIGPKLSLPYSQDLNDSYNGMDDEFETFPVSRTFRVTGKTESKPQNTILSNATTTVLITPVLEESPKQKSSIYNGRKHETITAEVFIRNPRNVKPTIINISTSDKEAKRPCWMILKAYESPSSTVDKEISRKKFDEKMTRIGSIASICEKIKKTKKPKATNFYETASTVTIPQKFKQEISERSQTKMSNYSNSDLRSKMTNRTVETETDTSIKSTFITEKRTSSNDVNLPNDFHTLVTMKTDETCKIHHTTAFERLLTADGELVKIYRRGSPIFFIFRYNNNPEILDKILIRFKNELANYEIAISAVRLSYLPAISKTNWHSTYKILTTNTALFEIITPSDIPIGLWQMIIGYDKTPNLCIVHLCILFNPWHKNDETYYSNEIELDEYVLNELAMMRKWQQNDAWLLGQFSAICINTTLHLLELCMANNLLKMNELGSASTIVKAIAAAISKFILKIKWSDFDRSNYENEILPSAWTGSKEIMATYQRMGNKIGYGQSWCYAGLLTSICRCIGIPSRMVTIYNFAPRIEDGTLIKLDIIDGMLAEKSKDTIWHYHIWNELWLQSKMLKNGSEWHICDATPTTKEQVELLNQGKALFPIRRIKNNDEKVKGQNDNEYFGQQLYGILNATIICNYYYRDPITRNPIFAYSKKLDKKYIFVYH